MLQFLNDVDNESDTVSKKVTDSDDNNNVNLEKTKFKPEIKEAEKNKVLTNDEEKIGRLGDSNSVDKSDEEGGEKPNKGEATNPGVKLDENDNDEDTYQKEAKEEQPTESNEQKEDDDGSEQTETEETDTEVTMIESNEEADEDYGELLEEQTTDVDEKALNKGDVSKEGDISEENKKDTGDLIMFYD